MNQVPKPSSQKCARPREKVCKLESDVSTRWYDKNELQVLYLYLSWDACLGLLADSGFFSFSFIFPFFYLFFLLFLDLVHKQGSFTMALGSFRLLMTWCPSQGLLCNSTRFPFCFLCLLMVSHGHTCHPKLNHHRHKEDLLCPWCGHLTPLMSLSLSHPMVQGAMSSYKGWPSPWGMSIVYPSRRQGVRGGHIIYPILLG